MEDARRCIAMLARLLAILTVFLFAQWGSAENQPEKDKEVILSPSESVIIAPNALRIPTEKMLLVRKNDKYGVVKLSDTESAGKYGRQSARFVCFYQKDGSGDFSKPNVRITEGELSQSKPIGIGRLAFDFGNKDIKCGPIRLGWSGEGWIYFYGTKQKQGDYGIQLAPTNWSHISEVNVLDERVFWYKYDLGRPTVTVALEDIW